MNKELTKLVKDLYFQYLDDLRLSGVCNMLESPRYLEKKFALTLNESIQIFALWANDKKRHEKKA